MKRVTISLALAMTFCARSPGTSKDGSSAGQDGGGAAPTEEVCGNGVVEAGEDCDDGNTNSGDGCSSTCNSESGWNCATPDGGKSTCTPICGDGVLAGGEVCDDGNTAAGDGCSPDWQVETGWECHGVPSVCTALPARVRTTPSLGAPITGLPNTEWSYVEFPNSTCGDGTPAGLLISPGSQDLLFFMEGGWFCANYADCVSAMNAVYLPPQPRSPLGSVNVSQRPSLLDYMNEMSNWNGTIFSRSDPDNAFKDFTFLYVMACTGDLHGGDAVVTYTSGSQSLTVNHKGHANIVAFLERVAATWPVPTRLVVAGASAGGLGTLFNYDTFRLFWPNPKTYLLDDSGTALGGVDFFSLPPMAGAWTLWNLQEALGDICTNCESDLSAIYAALYRWYPNDRKSLLSHVTDPVAIGNLYTSDSDAAFSAALRSTAAMVLEPNRWKWFYGGSGHTFISATPGNQPRTAMEMTTVVSAGVPLKTFLQAQVDDDPSWSSVTPP
ncbi:MAG TPA: pectin acetylesterase-family hydrolase [Polyangia bacterium]|jgi:Pectinacetylesterase.|nr:pectin acetylesterase-family hydrolase [Polyangia bacterium]